ncbi:MAG: DinB family protein [Clostridiales bacterium]|jgi:hypothetical protein|nr:DinB family protein [Clostridiales bacterium]
MEQACFSDIIRDQTRRALWEVKNAVECIPDALWDARRCDMPVWKHVYHMLHSLDRWFVNPRDRDFREPDIHEEGLNNLDVASERRLGRGEIDAYLRQVGGRIARYVGALTDGDLLQKPEGCEYARFTLILAQFRHLHTHMGMLMGFVVADSGKWPRVVGLENDIPEGEYDRYF